MSLFEPGWKTVTSQFTELTKSRCHRRRRHCDCNIHACSCGGCDFEEAARLANYAGGIVVMKYALAGDLQQLKQAVTEDVSEARPVEELARNH
jgi:hypothetical protein